ncbi:MAG: acetyl-CoA carboxylase, carboxyltransferase subunit beta [Pseudomonadota bacterium]
MSWLTNYVRPRISALVSRQDVPENLWHQCPSCERMIFHRDLLSNQRVCPHCDHHLRISAQDRLTSLLDPEFEPIELPSVPADPLKFRDIKRYSDRLREAQARSKHNDALIAARGAIDGLPAVVAVMDFSFMGGSMGAAMGEGFLTAARRAVTDQAAFIIVTASGGARMQEGAIALMQMARTTIAVDEVKEAGLPYIVILTDPTMGGVTASFAMLGDVHLAEPGAIIGFAGARVIEQTIREKLPKGFQRAEYLLDHGMIDQVVHRFKMRETLATILGLLMRPEVAPRIDEQRAEGNQTAPLDVEQVNGPIEEVPEAQAGNAAESEHDGIRE